MPALTHATDPEGLMGAMIMPPPRTAAGAEPLVPTWSSIDLKDVPRTVPTAPPSRPIPINSIPIRSTSGLTPATVYGRHRLGLALDSNRCLSRTRSPLPPQAWAPAAHELGDLSENFEYHAAKNEQGMMEARIKELEAIVKNHVLIETRVANGI